MIEFDRDDSEIVTTRLCRWSRGLVATVDPNDRREGAW